ncbi:TPA: hypothetical protein DEG21_05065 [Patescibacteria group bacterium]|nr:hypothetical protein [Candidatus Gracilibacteria bacterium]HBY75201.1 hypothetical protein [Candidatus Gracilibacteria bacterium]
MNNQILDETVYPVPKLEPDPTIQNVSQLALFQIIFQVIQVSELNLKFRVLEISLVFGFGFFELVWISDHLS